MSNKLEYKGYHTHIEIDFEDNMFYGKIEDIRDLVNFMSDIPDGAQGIISEFHSAVNDYLAFCSDTKENTSGNRDYHFDLFLRIARQKVFVSNV